MDSSVLACLGTQSQVYKLWVTVCSNASETIVMLLLHTD